MRDWPTRDELIDAAKMALLESETFWPHEDIDKAPLDLQRAEVVVDALIGAAMVMPAERLDEVCHVCEAPIRDHLEDGRHPWKDLLVRMAQTAPEPF